MVTIESYAYDLPGQSGFVARDRKNAPVAAAKTFRVLLDRLWALHYRVYRMKHATANTTRDSAISQPQNPPR